MIYLINNKNLFKNKKAYDINLKTKDGVSFVIKRNILTGLFAGMKYIGKHGYNMFNWCLENQTVVLFMLGGLQKVNALNKIKKIFQGGNIGLTGYEASTILKENHEGILNALNVKGVLNGLNVGEIKEGVVSVLNNSETIMQVAEVSSEPLLTPALVVGSSILAAKQSGVGVYSVISQIVGNSISTIGVGTSSVMFGGIIMPYILGPIIFPKLTSKIDKLNSDLMGTIATEFVMRSDGFYAKNLSGEYVKAYDAFIDPLKIYYFNYYTSLTTLEHIFVITSVSITMYGVYRMSKSSYNYIKEKFGYV